MKDGLTIYYEGDASGFFESVFVGTTLLLES